MSMLDLDVAFESSVVKVGEDEENTENVAFGYLADEVATVENHKRYGDWQLFTDTVLKTPEKFEKLVKEMGDESPMFVNYVLPSGFSRILTSDESGFNEPKHRYWSPDLFKQLANKINKLGSESSGLPGYRGHAASYDLHKLPPPAVLWVAAENATNVLNGSHAIIARAYVYRNENTREYVKTGAYDNASVQAVLKTQLTTINGENVINVEQANFLSIDLVRKGMEGIRNTKKISVEGAVIMNPELQKLLASMTSDQLKQYAPHLATEMANVKGDVSGEISRLANELQKKTVEVADLNFDAVMARKMAEELGCETSELSSFVSDYKTTQKSSIKVAIESELAKIGNESVRKALTTQLANTEFKSVEDVTKAVTAGYEQVKVLMADLGTEIGPIDENDVNSKKTKSFGIASPSMKRILQGGN